MAKEKMQTARDLIKAKRYDEARTILKTVDHPLAEQWLENLDQLAPSKAGTYEQAGETADWLNATKDETSGGGFLQNIDSSAVISADTGPSVAAIIPAFIGGLIGAVLGGAIWAGIAIVTDYEVGWVAIGVGFLTGGGVVLLGRRRGIPYQVIAVVLAVIAIGLGKYATYFFLSRNALIEQYGQEAWDAAGLTLTSPEFIQDFVDNLPAFFELMDILFIVLAVITAWSIPSVQAAKRAAERKLKASG